MFADQVIVFSEGGVYQFMVAKHLRFSVNIYLRASLRMFQMMAWQCGKPGWSWVTTPHSLATHKLVSFVFANISQTHNLHGP